MSPIRDDSLDVLLVQQPTGNWEIPLSALPIPLSLITAARQSYKEFRIRLVDVRATGLKGLDPFLAQLNLLIGMTVFTGEAILSARDVIEYARRRNPSAKILAGGRHPTVLPEETLRHPLVDYIIAGPGEFALNKLLAARRNGNEHPTGIPGVGFRFDGQIHFEQFKWFEPGDLDSFEFPAYDLVDVPKYLFSNHGLPTIYIQGSYGCNFRCAFCSASSSCEKWIANSPEYVIRHIEFLKSWYGIASFCFTDLNFFSDLDRVRRICELLIERKLNIRWQTQGIRVRDLLGMDREYLALLKASGLNEFEAVGVESGSQRIVDAMGKGFKISELLELNHRLKDSGLTPRYNFMIGVPGEEQEDRRATIDLALRLNVENPHAANSAFYLYTPFPGTRFYEAAVRLGFKPPDNFLTWGDLAGYDRSKLYDRKTRKTLEKIHFLSYFASTYYFDRFLRRFHLLRPFFAVYRRIALFRLRRDFVPWMPEFYLWRVLTARRSVRPSV